MSLDHDDGLSEGARSILDAARGAEDPSGEDLARVRGKIFAHLGLAAAGGATATLAATATAEGAAAATTTSVAAPSAVTTGSALAASALGGSSTVGSATAVAATGAGATLASASSLGVLAKMTMATKVGLAVLALGGVGTGVVVVTRGTEPAPVVATAPTVSTSTAEPSLGAPPTESGPRPEHRVAPPAAVAAEAPAGPASPVPPPASEPVRQATAAPSAPASGPDPLAEEAALLGRAQSALAAGRHAEALALLDEHARAFPRGVLAHERDAARWLALCGSGRVDAARAPVAAFLAEHPGSPLAARLRAACGLP